MSKKGSKGRGKRPAREPHGSPTTLPPPPPRMTPKPKPKPEKGEAPKKMEGVVTAEEFKGDTELELTAEQAEELGLKPTPKKPSTPKSVRRIWWEVRMPKAGSRCTGCGCFIDGQGMIQTDANKRKLLLCRHCGLRAIAKRVDALRRGVLPFDKYERGQLKEAVKQLGAKIAERKAN